MIAFEKINEHFDQWIKDEIINRKKILLDRLKTTEPLFKIIEEFINTDLEIIKIKEDVEADGDYDISCIYLDLTYKASFNNDTMLVMVDIADNETGNKTEIYFRIVLTNNDCVDPYDDDCVEFRFDCDNGLKYEHFNINRSKSLMVELVKFINSKMNYDGGITDVDEE